MDFRSPKTLIKLVLVGVLLVVGWFVGSYPRGMLMACFDHACGRLELRTYGYPIRISNKPFCDLLEARYGVQLVPIAGCVITPDVAWYAGGYNLVSRHFLHMKFGKDIFAECRAESPPDE